MWDSPAFKRSMDCFLAGLVWNARRETYEGTGIDEVYMPELEALWEEHGDDPHLYNRHYVERVRQLSGFRIGPAAMRIIETDAIITRLRNETKDARIHFAVDGSEPTAMNPLYSGPLKYVPALHAIANADGLETSPPTPPATD